MNIIGNSIGLIKGNKRGLGSIIPDVIISESHSDNMSITQHPIENGSTIHDHAHLSPEALKMQIAWSKSSVMLNGLMSGSIFQQGYHSLNDIYKDLLDLQRKREPCDVITGKRAYKDMLITSLSVTTDKDTENALIVDVSLQQVMRVSLQARQAKPETQAMPAKTVGVGNAGVRQPQPPAANSDTLQGVTQAIGG